MFEYQSRYLDPNAEDKKNCADPDVFGCQKHQYATQNKQCDGQESFCTRVSDHGCKKTLQASTNLTIDLNLEIASDRIYDLEF